MKADAPKPDPALAIERKRAEGERIDSMQGLLATRTANLTRLFGTAGRRKSLQGGAPRPAIAGI